MAMGCLAEGTAACTNKFSYLGVHIAKLPILRSLEEVGHAIVWPSDSSVNVIRQPWPVLGYWSAKKQFDIKPLKTFFCVRQR